MYVTPSALQPDASSHQAPRLAAIVYPDDTFPERAFDVLVAHCRSRNFSLAGVVQRRIDTTPSRRCNVVLEDLSSGHRTSIFEDRGAGARGCRLDEAAMAEAAARIEANLENAPDLLVLNKFGKAECTGGGLLDLIANAMERKIAVVIGVPSSNLRAWRDFAGDLAVEHSDGTGEIQRWMESLERSISCRQG